MRKLILAVVLLMVSTAAHSGLLTGQTPGNYSLPSGWELLATEDFEGSENPNYYWYGGSTFTSPKHDGTYSYGGTYSNDQDSVSWGINGDVIGDFTELYVSFYEYVDSNALMNDEFNLFSATKHVGNTVAQRWYVDWFWAYPYNSPNATLYTFGESNNQEGRTWLGASQGGSPSDGTWNQWEIHWRANTPGQSDGFARVYKNGDLYISDENIDTRGTQSMAGATIQVGGIYTRIIWMTDYPTCSLPSGCSSYIGDGSDYCWSQIPWQGYSFSNHPCWPSIPNFNRYYDDIIVMKTSGTSEGDVSPPYTNTNVPAKNSTGWPVNSRTISFYVRDPSGVTRSSIGVTIDGGATMRCGVELVCSP